MKRKWSHEIYKVNGTNKKIICWVRYQDPEKQMLHFLTPLWFLAPNHQMWVDQQVFHFCASQMEARRGPSAEKRNGHKFPVPNPLTQKLSLADNHSRRKYCFPPRESCRVYKLHLRAEPRWIWHFIFFFFSPLLPVPPPPSLFPAANHSPSVYV